ncbi:MAG: GH92 family glycosyl hydrolase, partial [Acidobacteriota bacterium]
MRKIQHPYKNPTSPVRHFLPLFLLILLFLLPAGCGILPPQNNSVPFSPKPAVDYINPMIGASTSVEAGGIFHGLGKTFPGAATPFGLVQLSPDTITGGDNAPGYSFHHPTIEGFSFTHMSGTGWYGDLGNLMVMPVTGPLKTSSGPQDNPEAGYRSRYSHQDETASAGYYAVTLSDYGIRTELTAAPRAGIIRFTYPESDLSRIQVDLARRIGGTSTEQFVKVLDDRTITGWMNCPPEGGGWGNGAGKADYTVYFHMQFSLPLDSYGFWSADIPEGQVRKRDEVASPEYQALAASAEIIRDRRELQGKHLGFFAEFPTSKQQQVLLKSGISFVSQEGARLNLGNDIPHWDFDRIHTQARQAWVEALSPIQVEGGTEDDRIIFNTALYHTMIDPRSISDINGRYTGADGKIHAAGDFTYRTIFSGWDVFRSQFPLQTLINPEMVNDEINSLIEMAELSGNEYFPRWEILNSYSGCMIGNPAVSVLADAYIKGIRGYDVEKAFQYALNSVDKFGNGTRGYVPEKLSETLEYAYFDWCVARLAEALGKEKISREYLKKSEAWRNVWDPEVQWMRARRADGSWLPWKGKLEHGQGCVESNPFQQGWFVPHDIPGLISLMGKDFFLTELNTFFDKAPEDFLWNDYYNHPNEPVHHVPFLFNFAGAPYLTQKWTRAICANAYGT